MLAKFALLACFAALVKTEGYELTLDQNLYKVNGFLNTGTDATYDYAVMDPIFLLLDTLNRKSFVFLNGCTTCPASPKVAPGLFQQQPQFGIVSYGIQSKVFGKQGVTEMGIASSSTDAEPNLAWLQQSLAVTRATNVNATVNYTGNLALGRGDSDGKYESALGSIAGLMDGDSTFCLDLGFYNPTTPTLQIGSAQCNLIESESCGLITQLPIYAAEDATWNVAMSSFTYGDASSDPIAFSSRVIFDTTKDYAIFPKAAADDLATAIAAEFGIALVTDYANGLFSYRVANTTSVDTPLLINFSSYDPFTSPLSKFFEVPATNYLTWDVANTVTNFNFYGSNDACIVGNADGYKSFIGTLFMRGSYFGFHPGYITIVQQETIPEEYTAKAAALTAGAQDEVEPEAVEQVEVEEKSNFEF